MWISYICLLSLIYLFCYCGSEAWFQLCDQSETERGREGGRSGTSSHLWSAVELWGSFLCFCTSANGTVAQRQLLHWEFPFKNAGKTSLKKG